MSDQIVLRGVRPAALAAVSKRERLRAHPHRVQAAVNHVRALKMTDDAARSSAPPVQVEQLGEETGGPQLGTPACPTTPKKRGHK